MEPVIFIDNPQGEGLQNHPFQFRIHNSRMIPCDKTHLTGKGEIKIEDPASLPITYRIIYISFGTDRSPGVIAVDFREILIHVLPIQRLILINAVRNSKGIAVKTVATVLAVATVATVFTS